MGREIRISIDDDEVFERMKRRKAELDLSWEEVLYRGLRRDAAEERGPRFGPGPADPFGPADRHRPNPAESPSEFAESIKNQVRDQVLHSLQSSLGGVDDEYGYGRDDGLDAEVGALESAEDATLAFEFLPDRAEYRVPLRVNLRTAPDGLAVDVVAVRQGKSVRDANRFDGEHRRRITDRLARGEPATLRFPDGVESYRVRPVISWGRDGEGAPTVTDVEIAEVLLDGE